MNKQKNDRIMNGKIYLAAAFALALTACNNENEPTAPTDGKVAAKITAEIGSVQTRATGTVWSPNDAIGISTVPGPKTDYTNVPYKYNGSSFEAVSGVIYFQSQEEVTFNAYYPYNDNGGTIEAETTTDNQTDLEQPKIDFLFAEGARASKTAPRVAFVKVSDAEDYSFHHRMSRITLKLLEGNGISFAGKLTGYSLEGLVMQGTFNTATGEAKAKDGAAASVLPISLTDASATNKLYTTAPVILFPQPVSGGKFTLKVTVDDETYKATLTLPNDATALVAGSSYTFPVTVKKNGLVVGDAEITDWNEEEGDSTEAVM